MPSRATQRHLALGGLQQTTSEPDPAKVRRHTQQSRRHRAAHELTFVQDDDHARAQLVEVGDRVLSVTVIG